MAIALTLTTVSIAGGVLLSINGRGTGHITWTPLLAFVAPYLTAAIREGEHHLEQWARELRDFRRRHPAVEQIPPWNPSARELRLQQTSIYIGAVVVAGVGLVIGGLFMEYHSGIEGLYVTLGAVAALGIPTYLMMQVQLVFRRRWSRRNSIIWWQRKVKEDQTRQLSSPWQWRTRALFTDGRTTSTLLPVMAIGFLIAAGTASGFERFGHDQVAQIYRAGAVMLLVLAHLVGRTWGRGSRALPIVIAVGIVGLAAPIVSLLAGVEQGDDRRDSGEYGVGGHDCEPRGRVARQPFAQSRLGLLGHLGGRGAAATAAQPASEVALVPRHEELRGDADAGVGSRDHADEDGEQERTDRVAAEQQHRSDGEQQGDRGIQGARERLHQGGVDVVGERSVR
jgi:hypothetical protein